MSIEKIEITGNPVRHKKRIEEMQKRFEENGTEVEIIYKNTNYIRVRNVRKKT